MMLASGAAAVDLRDADGAVFAAPLPLGRLQRASGHAWISFRRRGAATLVHRLYQEGSAKVRLPRHPAGEAEAVLINTAGGLTGGDRFAHEVALAEGAAATLTTQACERIYRSPGGDADVRTAISLAAGARLDWLPQETILFDGGRLRRGLQADLAEDATLLAVEAVVFGRQARGETVRAGLFRDRWRIRRAGRLVFADNLRFEGPIAAELSRPAVLAGNGALATVLFVGPAAEDHLTVARELLGDRGGASAWDGKLVLRLAARDGFALRQTLVPALEALRGGRSLPRAWQI